MQQRIIDLLVDEVKRPGVDNLIMWLEQSDFFTAPCSRKHHLCKVGGLAEHSLNVLNLLDEKTQRYKIDVPFETIIVCALGHDLCKVNYYVINEEPASVKQVDYLRQLSALSVNAKFTRYDELTKDWASALIQWYKTSPEQRTNTPPLKTITYVKNDTLPIGHGEKSLSILQNFIPLTDLEKLCIRWHMGMTEPGTHFHYPTGEAYNAAVKLHPLVALLHTADYEASMVVEREVDAIE